MLFAQKDGGSRVDVREALLAASIRVRLHCDTRVGHLLIELDVVESDVRLVGHVDTLEQCDIAEFITRGTPGVRSVDTDSLEVTELGGFQAAETGRDPAARARAIGSPGQPSRDSRCTVGRQ